MQNGKLSYYQQLIKNATNCADIDLQEIENYMCDVILNYQPLNSLTSATLNNAARIAHHDVMYMRTPEGIAHIEKITNEILNH